MSYSMCYLSKLTLRLGILFWGEETTTYEGRTESVEQQFFVK